MNPTKNISELTLKELNSLKETLTILGRQDIIKEVEKEIKRRK